MGRKVETKKHPLLRRKAGRGRPRPGQGCSRKAASGEHHHHTITFLHFTILPFTLPSPPNSPLLTTTPPFIISPHHPLHSHHYLHCHYTISHSQQSPNTKLLRCGFNVCPLVDALYAIIVISIE
jgi:hypothetical protein